MDPVTGFVLGTMLMLLNGAILGLVHRDLPSSLKRSADDWRISTLLVAGGSIFFAVQAQAPLLLIPLANGLVMLGFTGYWRALRRFYGQPDSPWLFLPSVIGVGGIAFFAAVHPSLVVRVAITTAVWAVSFIGSILTLVRGGAADRAISRRVLIAIFGSLTVIIVARCAYFVSLAALPTSVLDRSSWVNVATPLLAAALPVIGTTAYLLLLFDRISRQWERAASTDYLTGLANRLTLGREGDLRLERARSHGDPLAIAVVDVDHFKHINDRFGHDVGDLALRHVAARLQGACRGKDLPARQGGEEFVILFDRTGADQARAAGERIRQAVEAVPFLADGEPRTITVSIGVAALAEGDTQFQDLIRRADRALYAAKSGGRNRVELAVD